MKHPIKHILNLSLFSFLILSPVTATNYFCDPGNGSMANDGSSEHPWSTLQAVFENHKSFVAGDTIFLMQGDHGSPYLYGRNEDYVVITGYGTDTATVTSLRFSAASYWEVNGLHIISELPDGKDVYDMVFLVQSSSNSDHLIFKDCEISSARDTRNWNRDDWFTRTSCGIMSKSTWTGIYNNKIRNINFGLVVEGQHTEVEGNTIENFVGDGIRGLASYCRYEYNIVKNCYDVTGYSPSEEGPGAARFTVYPNPVRGTLNITNLRQATMVELINMTGAKVKSLKLQGQYRVSIDMSGLTNGVYILKITSGNKVATRMVVKN